MLASIIAGCTPNIVHYNSISNTISMLFGSPATREHWRVAVSFASLLTEQVPNGLHLVIMHCNRAQNALHLCCGFWLCTTDLCYN